MSSSIGGGHRQRGTLRLLQYWAAWAVDGTRVFYSAVITDKDGAVDQHDGEVDFDPDVMSAGEAARADLGRYIDSAILGPGKPPEPRPMPRWGRL